MYKDANMNVQVFDSETKQSLDLVLTTSTTVEELIEQLCAELGHISSELILNFNKKPLTQATRKLSDYGIGDRSVIDVEVMEAKGPGFLFNKLQNMQTSGVTKSRTGLRTLMPGILFETTCQNQNCRAFKKEILVRKGLGSFNIGKQAGQCICQICGEMTPEATNIGFYKSKIKISGRKQGERKQTKLEIIAEGRKYYSFRQQSNEDLIKWNFLEVQADPL